MLVVVMSLEVVDRQRQSAKVSRVPVELLISAALPREQTPAPSGFLHTHVGRV